MNAAAIRDELITSNDEDIKRRRKIILLSALGLVDFSFISLYQTGVIKRMPDLPFKIFDSNKVNTSKSAYVMGVPDGTVSAVVYAANMALAAAGGSKNSGRKYIFDVALAASVIGNAAGAAYYLYDMIFKQKKICMYCVAGAAINFASAAILAPTISKSVRKLFRK